MKSFGLLALLPALTCAFFLPIPPLFSNQLLNSSLVSLVSHDSNTSQIEARDVNMTDTDFKEICTIVHFAESELCGNTSSTSRRESRIPPEFCSLLSLMNQTFCQDETREKREKREKHVNENEINEINETNEDTYEKFYGEVYIEEIKNKNSSNTDLTPKDLCPIFDLVDKTFCTSHENKNENKNKLNPKDLCPLLEFVEKELCV
jgi:hypothetical protein